MGLNCENINGVSVDKFVFNDDGTVSGLVNVNGNEEKTVLSENCCNALNFIWDDGTTNCYWSDKKNNPDFKITLGGNGNDGVLYQIDDNETCHLEVEFDYIFQFDCDTINSCLVNDLNCLDVFSNLSVSVVLDKLINIEPIPNVVLENNVGLETIYSDYLYNPDNILDYFDNNCNTGLLLTGSTQCVNQMKQCVTTELGENCGVFSTCTLDSNWVHHKFVISDNEILSGITNEKIKLGFLINNCECDISILIDNIKINKVCTIVDNEDIFITKCPSFEIERICDNKKSWVDKETKQQREYNFPTRETKYEVNQHKLVLNTKEVDIDISPPKAIETDVWCYIKDNEEILNCSTGLTTTTIPINHDFQTILINNLLLVEPNCSDDPITCLGQCDIISNWGLSIKLECNEIYNNQNFYSGTSIMELPTLGDYINELSGATSSIGLDMLVVGDNAILSDFVDCTNNRFINNNIKIDLLLDITINCDNDTKSFQNTNNFNFQSGIDYNFN